MFQKKKSHFEFFTVNLTCDICPWFLINVEPLIQAVVTSLIIDMIYLSIEQTIGCEEFLGVVLDT